MVAMAYSSPVVIANTVLVQERASLVVVPAAPSALPAFVAGDGDSSIVITDAVVYNEMAAWGAPQVFPQVAGQLAVADSSPVIVDNLVLYPAVSRGPLTPPVTVTPAPAFGWWFPFAERSLRAAPIFVQPHFIFEQPFPPVSPGTWFDRWPDPPARGAINVAALISGYNSEVFSIFTTPLPPNVANWYMQYPIPPARGAINVGALISGFTWSIVATGGVVQNVRRLRTLMGVGQ